MSDVLAKIAMHGHPIGFMIGGAFLLTLLLAGFWATRDSSKRVKVVWLIAAGLLACRVPITVWVYSAYELSPKVSKAEVIGVWAEGDLRLELRPDGGFQTGREIGVWRMVPVAGLELTPPPLGFESPHFVRFNGELRLQRFTGDPDEWDGTLGMHRRP